MKNFRLVQQDVAIDAILAEIARQPDAWDAQTGRQRVRVQREARAIPIRGLRKSKMAGRARRDVHESRYTTISKHFPAVITFLETFAAEVSAELGRAKIVSLPAGARVYPHVDRGEYYRLRDRYHLVLLSHGSWMRAGDEEVVLHERELWWFDNKADHEARNDTDADRIHLIFDLGAPQRPRRR